MRARSLFSWLIVASVVGCSDSDKAPPAAAGSSEQDNPALLAAPPGLRALETGRYCGRRDVVLGRERQPSTPRCFASAVESRAAASFTLVIPTVEGDPVPRTYVARNNGDLLAATDSTRDKNSSGGWTLEQCRGLGPSRLVLVGCENGTTIDERTPAGFAARNRLRYCGRIEAEPPIEALIKPGRELLCLDRSWRAGRPAELRVSSRNEEGLVTTYLRVLGPSALEVFEDASRGGTGPPAWYSFECERFSALRLSWKACTPERTLSPG